jgi:hypothetical protein
MPTLGVFTVNALKGEEDLPVSNVGELVNDASWPRRKPVSIFSRHSDWLRRQIGK